MNEYIIKNRISEEDSGLLFSTMVFFFFFALIAYFASQNFYISLICFFFMIYRNGFSPFFSLMFAISRLNNFCSYLISHLYSTVHISLLSHANWENLFSYIISCLSYCHINSYKFVFLNGKIILIVIWHDCNILKTLDTCKL